MRLIPSYVSSSCFFIVLPDHEDYFRVGQTFTCREQFHRAWKRPYRYLGFRPSTTGKKVMDFIHRVEDALKITHSKSITNDGLLLIELSPFWRRSLMRAQFFTCLCRAGQDYNGSNYKTCLYGNGYFDRTPRATKNFMNGKTAFSPRHRFKGWVVEFSEYYGASNIERKMRFPK